MKVISLVLGVFREILVMIPALGTIERITSKLNNTWHIEQRETGFRHF